MSFAKQPGKGEANQVRAGQTPKGPSPAKPMLSAQPRAVETPATTPSAELPSGRVMSIDAVRGFDMFWICGGREVFLAVLTIIGDLIVRVMGRVPELPKWITELPNQMKHCDWEGFTAWDLIMPLFLFIVGTSMPFSFAKRLQSGKGKGDIYLKVLLRCLILWVLGMAVQGNLLKYRWSEMYFYSNTLQSIAAGYLIASVVMLNLRPFWQLVATAGLLAGYWAILRYVPFAGTAPGTLEPQQNLALYVDQLILGQHMPQGVKFPYAWIVASLAFGATVLLGVMSGHILASGQVKWKKFLWLTLAGLVCLGAGWGWSYWFPIIKHLFTSSMVLWACGWSFLLLALFYLLIDVWGLRRWAFFFVVIGMNAIAVYVGTHVFGSTLRQISNTLVGNLLPYMSENLGKALMALATFAVTWLILYFLYRKRTFIRV